MLQRRPICAGCGHISPLVDGVCATCAQRLDGQPALDRWHASGLRLLAAAPHTGLARQLVHAVKYRGIEHAAHPLAARMVPLVPAETAVLVPIPRVPLRVRRHGVDPAVLLAHLVGRQRGIPVVRALRPPIWWPRQAGRGRTHRKPGRFRMVHHPSGPIVLVDDVVTTGGTIAAAAAMFDHPVAGLSATGAGIVSEPG